MEEFSITCDQFLENISKVTYIVNMINEVMSFQETQIMQQMYSILLAYIQYI